MSVFCVFVRRSGSLLELLYVANPLLKTISTRLIRQPFSQYYSLKNEFPCQLNCMSTIVITYRVCVVCGHALCFVQYEHVIDHAASTMLREKEPIF